MRLIDADRLLEALRKSCKWHAQNSRELSLLQRDIIIVQEQPTVDAEQVILCKDCKFHIEIHCEGGGEEPYIKHQCRYLKGYQFPEDYYCGLAERIGA